MHIKADTSSLNAEIARLRGLSDREIAKAAAAAINVGVWKGAEAGRTEMGRVFDRPTAWVQKGIRYKKARPDALSGQIDLDFWGNKQGVAVDRVLAAEIDGGERRAKRHEVALRRIGVLPDGMFIVPGEGAKLDAFGNMQAGQINQILSFFSAFGEVGYKANMKEKQRSRLKAGSKSRMGFEYFAVTPGTKRTWGRANGKLGSHKMAPGIYERVYLAHGTAIRPVMLFVKPPRYAKRYDFYGVSGDTAEATFGQAYDDYLRTFLDERGL